MREKERGKKKNVQFFFFFFILFIYLFFLDIVCMSIYFVLIRFHCFDSKAKNKKNHTWIYFIIAFIVRLRFIFCCCCLYWKVMIALSLSSWMRNKGMRKNNVVDRFLWEKKHLKLSTLSVSDDVFFLSEETFSLHANVMEH